MNKVIPFEAAHLSLIEMRELERVQLEADPRTLAKFQALEASHQGATFIREGRIIAFMGYMEMWPGVIEIWSFPSKYILEYAFTYLRQAKTYLDAIERDFKPHRMQTSALADSVHDRWMYYLGFEEEGYMPKYSVNQLDYRMWGKTFPREEA